MVTMDKDKIILFAEVDTLIQRVIKKKLESQGYKVLLASDGLAAEECINAEKIDIVVTEEMLPFKSGFELIKLCDEKNIPAIIISDADLENKILEAFDMGAYDFIDKPYSPNELLVRIQNIFKHHVV